MLGLLKKYEAKLVGHGLCRPGAPLVGGVNDVVLWNRPAPQAAELERVIGGLNINSMLFARPVEPFAGILDYLCRHGGAELVPGDTETRTFLHSIPIARHLDADELLPLLRRRKGCLVAGRGIVATGTVSPEQAFVVFSSIAFAAFVKFFVDHAYAVVAGRPDPEAQALLQRLLAAYDALLPEAPGVELEPGPFAGEEAIVRAMSAAGRATVAARLVDSFFGNISYFTGDTVHISQTGSSLDELEGCIDACPLDNSACTGITASSELTAHRDIYLRGGGRSILHGHPRFSVIMSMLCFEEGCRNRGRCHIRCERQRSVAGVPVVPGEVGTGPRGLSNTLPPAILEGGAAIVYGHGVFTTGEKDFRDAFARLLEIERASRAAYLEILAGGAGA